MKYKSKMHSTDILSPERLLVGGKRHVQVLNLLGNLTSEEEEDLVRLVLHGWSQADIAEEFGLSQSAISKRLRKLLRNVT